MEGIDKNETISVVVPVYNVEKYIIDALDSVCNQTYRDLEMIIVDDGSTDNSGKICDEYAQKDSRITVLHQSNAGAAAAKNAGLRIATGKYLAFLDSDDYLEPDAYEYMISTLKENDADVIQCAFRDVYVNAGYDRIMIAEKQVFSTAEYLKRFTEDWTCGLLWDKVYKRSLFEGICFEEGHKIDDEFFTYRGIMNADTIIYMPKIVYNYRKRKSSVMLSADSQEKIISDKLEYLTTRRKLVTERFPALKDRFDSHYLNMLVILSKDPNTSFAQHIAIKKAVIDYLKAGNRIRIENVLMLELGKILILSPALLLKRAKSKQTKCSTAKNDAFIYYD